MNSAQCSSSDSTNGQHCTDYPEWPCCWCNKHSDVCECGRCSKRGFTLIELMVAMLIFSIVGVSILKAFVLNQRTYVAQSQQTDVQQNLRMGIYVLPADLRQLDAAEGDILAMSATSLTIRSQRQLGILCQSVKIVNPVTLTIRQKPFYGTQLNNTKDGLYLAYEGDESIRADDRWFVGAITSPLVNAVCADGKPGFTFTTTLTFGALPLALDSAWTGAVVRGYRQVTYGSFLYTDGRWYVGMKDTSAAMLPLIGPLTGSTGLTLTYLDKNGIVTAIPANVAQIGILIREQTVTKIRQSNMTAAALKTDSIATVVTLRNNPRF